MIKLTFLTLFTIVVLLTGSIAGPVAFIQPADAVKGKGVSASNINSKLVCGDRLCSDISEEKPKEVKKKEQIKQEKKSEEAIKAKDHPLRDKKEEMMAADTTSRAAETVTGVVTSVQDPGQGHEGHQLSMILSPSEDVYRGHLSYAASENVQLVVLHGPLEQDVVKGQATWTPDGKTIYGLTFVDDQKDSGFWPFSGNALALHTKNTEQFTATYSVTYTELSKDNDRVLIGTKTSVQDPGIGREGHQLTMVLPLNEESYRGNITFDASEKVQIISLIGPLPGSLAPDLKRWTVDGKSIYGIVLGSPKSAGSTIFTGNAIGFYSEGTEPFTVSYSLVLTK